MADAASLSILTAKVAGLTSAGVFAGYVWALSRATVPSILDYGPNDEAVLLAQWRNQYVDGAAVSRPCSLINAISFGYLASRATADASPVGISIRSLYVMAAVATAMGVPWALTLLRRTNGALSIRSKRLIGPYGGTAGEPVCLTYASNEQASIDRESREPSYRSTRALILRWKWHNDCRTALLVLGTVAGAIAVALDA